MLVTDKTILLPVVPAEPIHCADPQLPLTIFIQRPDLAIAEAVWILRIVLVDRELIPVIPVQTIPRSKPHVSLFVLHDRKDGTLGETVFHRQVIKAVFSWGEIWWDDRITATLPIYGGWRGEDNQERQDESHQEGPNGNGGTSLIKDLFPGYFHHSFKSPPLV